MGFKFRLYPNKTQRHLLNRTLGCARFVYNHFLAVRREQWRANHVALNYVKTSALLTDLKRREEYAWLKEADSMALQEALRNLDRAYQNFFKLHAGYSRFKSKHAHSQSYRTRNQGKSIRILGNRVKLPKIGAVKIKQSRTFDGRILNAAVSRAASGKYFLSLCVEMERSARQKTKHGGEIGIDVELKAFYSDSQGHAAANPRILRRLTDKLRREQRRLSHKLPRSENRRKQRIRLARVHERITNIRKDFLHKQTTRLVRENQTIAVEHLHIKGMMKNHRVAKAISDVSWHEFFRQLTYKTEL